MFKDLDTMDARQFRALTGMTREAFDKLLILFTASYEEIKLEAYERDRAERQRKPGGRTERSFGYDGEEVVLHLVLS